jgi:hypothetical protein
MFGCQKVRLVSLLKLVVLDFFSTKTHELIAITVHIIACMDPIFFSTKTHELIAITVHIIACMDHFVIGEPTSMIHSVTAM